MEHNMTAKQPDPAEQHSRSLKDYLGIAARGFCMGAADIVPGVSGGTMAFITGIYQELVDAIRSVDLALAMMLLRLKLRDALEKFPWRFMCSLLAGILLAIALFSHFLKHHLDANPGKVLAFFFGLVGASIVTVARRGKPWNRARISIMAISALAAYFLVGLVPAKTPDELWFVFICGVIAFCALILPGISGSFMLLVLGKYGYVLDRVNGLKESLRAFDLSGVFSNSVPLFVLTVGGAVGLVGFCRVLSWLLKNHYLPTVAGLTGLMIGSLRKVWPWKIDYFGGGERNVWPPQVDGDFWANIGLILAGLAAVLIIEWLARAKGEGEGDGAEGQDDRC